MGNYLEAPKTEENGSEGSFRVDKESLEYALSSIQGWRATMEDAHFHYTRLPANEEHKTPAHEDVSLFGIFDGHGGTFTSEYAAENMLEVLQSTKEYKQLSSAKSKAVLLKSALESTFPKLDENLKSMPEFSENCDRSGSTGIVSVLTPEHVVFANCGDSRAIYVRNNSVAFFTRDHKPYDPEEQRRIENAGGRVTMRRVNGDLAVSRALGDFAYKDNYMVVASEQQVSATPDVTVVKRNNDMDQFILLACDGVWDVMSNEEVCAFVLNKMELGYSVRQVAKALVHKCLWSRDNISVLIVALPGAPKAIGTLRPENVSTDDTMLEGREMTYNAQT